MTHTPKFFKSSRQKIEQHIVASIQQQKKELSLVGPPWLGSFFDELLQFAKKGKMIRGSLVLFGVQLAGKKINKKAISLAVAMEFMHSSFLIHDDIMDRDELRRGYKTLHRRFEDFGRSQKINEPDHFGTSSAICIGDLGFFLSYNYLELSDTSNTKSMQAVRDLFYKEVSKVALAQIVDIAEGMKESITSMNVILNMYKHKTARYTFSLPLVMGALYAGGKKSMIQKLNLYGENTGMLFQIQDDYLSLFGDPKQTGKNRGTDIKEGKKTPYYILLMERISIKEKKQIKKIQRQTKVLKMDIVFIRGLMSKYKIIKDIEKLKHRLYKEAEKNVTNLQVSVKFKKDLMQVLKYVGSRAS